MVTAASMTPYNVTNPISAGPHPEIKPRRHRRRWEWATGDAEVHSDRLAQHPPTARPSPSIVHFGPADELLTNQLDHGAVEWWHGRGGGIIRAVSRLTA
jgi:hypothetical protein